MGARMGCGDRGRASFSGLRVAATWAVVSTVALGACKADELPTDDGQVTEERVACRDSDPRRQVFFGDFHVHTSFSFDARSYGNRLLPADAYAFAKGQAVTLAPSDQQPARTTRLARPLDFAAVTDHGEFLGEVALCQDPSAPAYATAACTEMRQEGADGALVFGVELARATPARMEEVCDPSAEQCLERAEQRWKQLKDAADAAYDRTAACEFTSFLGYEYTNTSGVSNLHRNVIFASDVVPDRPISYFEEPDPAGLLRRLRAECREGQPGCDVISIPHNSNLSNGNLFSPMAPGAETEDEEREVAELRAEMEPLIEVFQHKGDSECRPGYELGEPDPLCAFEKLRPATDELCGDTPGIGGMRLGGCSHRLDFVRPVLEEGLAHRRRLGVNPYAFGMIGSTDTHNGTPGQASTLNFPGHIGLVDDTAEKRLGSGTVTHDGVINNPGGLVAVWAEENSRSSIFSGLKRKEVYATSGPRIELRFFGGWDLSSVTCGSGFVAAADDAGVPMGARLEGQGAAPQFAVQARLDPGTAEEPGVPLEQIQIIKGWVSADGTPSERVVAVVGEVGEGPDVDPGTCEPLRQGAETLCEVWEDPDFDPTADAFYYARVVEVPTCRWSHRLCNELADPKPEACSDETVAKTVQQRAWSSPIWFQPE